MLTAFAQGSAISLFAGGDSNFAFLSGILSATATAVHGVSSPLFKRWTGRDHLTGWEEMLRTGIGVILGAGWYNVAMGYSPNEKQLVITTVAYTFLSFYEGRRDVNKANWILIVPGTKPIKG